MSQHSQQGEEGGAAPPAATSAPGVGGASEGGGGRPLHFRSFKLRFAAQREPGRSDVSAVKPLGLPATVASPPQRLERGAASPAELRAAQRVRRAFTSGPRDTHPAPLTSAHEYGWWWKDASKIAAATFSDRRLNHHIRDSSWLKTRLLVLAADDKLKQR